jgi:dihydrofolate reductase
MSLDGFIAGPDDAMDWVFEYTEPSATVEYVKGSIGAILAGRGSYDVGRRDAGKPSGEPSGGWWKGPVFVLTHDPPDDDPSIKFLSGDIRDAVATAMAAAEGKSVVVFGADLARQCVERGLMDEIVIHLAPVLLGDGVPLFAIPGGRHVRLELTSVDRSGQLTDLRFRVAK